MRRQLAFWTLACAASGWQPRPLGRHHLTPRRAAFHAEGDLSGAFQLSGVWKLERESDDAVEQVPIQPTNPSWSGDRWSDVVRELAHDVGPAVAGPAWVRGLDWHLLHGVVALSF